MAFWIDWTLVVISFLLSSFLDSFIHPCKYVVFLDKQRVLIVDCRLDSFRHAIRLRSKYIALWSDGVISCIGSVPMREMNFSIPGVQKIKSILFDSR